MGNRPRRKGRPSRASKALRARPGPHSPGRPNERGVVRLLRDEGQPADYEHWHARRALYEALPSYAPQEYSQLADAAAEGKSAEDPRLGFVVFLDFLKRWLSRYQFVPDPASGEAWPVWFTNDIIDSYLPWDPDQGPFRIAPKIRSDERIDGVEAGAVLRVQLVEIDTDENGNDYPRIMSRAEIMKSLVNRFTALIDPRLDEMIARANRLGVVAKPRKTLDDDMRRYVLKQFRGLDSIDIAAAEERGDTSFDLATPEERANFSKVARNKVDRAIKRAAIQLGVPARNLRASSPPTKATGT